ncbi:hypothetical protein HSR122_1870 [Halapricum desulfuricans]|uniref:Uncharacterized protein n=1 Tax=Halapricum desulfuricans TaxID=2841257 RepID=A0A897NCT9_9EURY|nr:hypothetical protein HSR122_1870 [Halapricum desulfuricans]
MIVIVEAKGHTNQRNADVERMGSNPGCDPETQEGVVSGSFTAV